MSDKQAFKFFLFCITTAVIAGVASISYLGQKYFEQSRGIIKKEAYKKGYEAGKFACDSVNHIITLPINSTLTFTDSTSSIPKSLKKTKTKVVHDTMFFPLFIISESAFERRDDTPAEDYFNWWQQPTDSVRFRFSFDSVGNRLDTAYLSH